MRRAGLSSSCRLTPDRWRDLEKLFGPDRGANSGCWCMWWRLKRDAPGAQMPKAERKARFRKVVTKGPPVGLLALRADEPLGWVQVAPRRATPTFNTSPVAAPADPQDDLDQVWAITCFYIAAAGRRSGIAHALAAAAVEHAFAHGAVAVEACPKEAGRARQRGPVHGNAVDIPPPGVPRDRAPHAGAAADAARAAARGAAAPPARPGEECSLSWPKSSASSRCPRTSSSRSACSASLLMATRFARAGRRLAVDGVILLAIIGLSPFGNAIILPLEQRFPPWDAARGAPTGIICLGGAVDTVVSPVRGEVALNEAAERMTAMAELARRYPNARIVFTGGSGRFLYDGATESELAARLFDELRHREGAHHAGGQIARHAGERALHPGAGASRSRASAGCWSPRRITCRARSALFRAEGFPVEAFPVDYRTRGAIDMLRPFSPLERRTAPHRHGNARMGRAGHVSRRRDAPTRCFRRREWHVHDSLNRSERVSTRQRPN